MIVARELWSRTGPVWEVDGRAFDPGISHRLLEVDCADVALRVAVLAESEPPLPDLDPEATPAVAFLAAVMESVAWPEGLVALDRPTRLAGGDKVDYLRGINLLGVCDDADEGCWDRALSRGIPCYGVCGDCHLPDARPRARSILAGLAYGNFLTGPGPVPDLREDREGVSWSGAGRGAEVAVVVRGGFEASRIRGDEGSWRDRGSEAYVRLVFELDGRLVRSQPRMVMPLGPAPAGPGQRP